jgi:hypothetical protein
LCLFLCCLFFPAAGLWVWALVVGLSFFSFLPVTIGFAFVTVLVCERVAFASLRSSCPHLLCRASCPSSTEQITCFHQALWASAWVWGWESLLHSPWWLQHLLLVRKGSREVEWASFLGLWGISLKLFCLSQMFLMRPWRGPQKRLGASHRKQLHWPSVVQD